MLLKMSYENVAIKVLTMRNTMYCSRKSPTVSLSVLFKRSGNPKTKQETENLSFARDFFLFFKKNNFFIFLKFFFFSVFWKKTFFSLFWKKHVFFTFLKKTRFFSLFWKNPFFVDILRENPENDDFPPKMTDFMLIVR